MKIKAIIFMSNDHLKLDFTLKNFRFHHPNIPVLVYNNGGKSAEHIALRYGCEYKDIENLWHKDTHCGVGSFGYEWFEYLFEYALREDDFTHILFLETDVFTIRSIKNAPAYDMAGPTSFCGPKEIEWYDYFNLKSMGYEYKFLNGTRAFTHTGCGGTIYTKEFFKKSKKHLPLVKKAFEDRKDIFYMDLMISILGIISGCTVGDWSEANNIHGNFKFNTKINNYQLVGCDWKSALIHGVKYSNKFKLKKDILKSYLKNCYHFMKNLLMSENNLNGS